MLALGLGGLIVALVAGLLIFRQVKAADSIELPNGKAVRVGQSSKALLSDMGSDLSGNASNQGVLRYPASDIRSDANIFVVDGKVVAVMVARSEKSMQLGTGITVGTSTQELTSKLGKSLQRINLQTDVVKHRGYKVVGSRTVTYYVTSTCRQNNVDEKVSLIAVAKKESVSRMTYLTRPLQCGSSTNTPT
jgi:hypothetical protein